ncbi:MAG: hypothetical protein BIFFINMI_02516 [Phycisphaerae bacterium]|nr:hypothetical protein [Phycisphaerae bacterium]
MTFGPLLRIGSAALLLATISCLLAAAPAADDASAPPADAGTTILTGQSYFRWYLHLSPPMSSDPAATGVKNLDRLSSPPPPDGWRSADFDDRAWPRSRPAWLDELVSMYWSGNVLCLRGRFNVTDPAAVRALTLSLAYRGGAAVYLNGREVARANLPAGDLTPGTLGEMYPDTAFVQPNGREMPDDYHRGQLEAGDLKTELNARVASRTRRLTALKLPVSELRKGVNVLAIEIHRSKLNANVLSRFVPSWHGLDVGAIEMTAEGSGVQPNVGRPAGVQVWNQDVNDRVTAMDYGDPCEPLGPARIVAARNGTWSAQVAVGSPDAIKDLKAQASDLAADGGAKIPASAVRLLYGRMDWPSQSYIAWCDALTAALPAEVPVYMQTRWQQTPLPMGAVLPIRIEVRVPADAAAGDYRGTVTLSAAGLPPTAVPVELHVAAWSVPDPSDYRTYVGIYQSPTSVAMQYGVPEWSNEHFKLLEKSWELLSRAGNKLILVNVVDQTQFGNPEGMIRFIPKEGGGYDYDFSIFDRYMKLALKYCPKPEFVAFQIWHSGGWETRKADEHNTITVADPKTGKHEHVQVPVFGSEESKKLWKPALAAFRDRLDKLGLADTMIMGILSDGTAPEEVFRMFDEVWPGGGPARWMRGLHSQNGSPKPYRASRGGGVVVLHEHCYGLNLPNPDGPLPKIHAQRGKPAAAYHRISGHESAATLIWYRNFPEISLFFGTRGVGRICLDFWNVLKLPNGHRDWIYNRYPFSSCAQRAPSLQKMTWPGPSGAETTVRLEAFIEGLQEAEAGIVLSEAMNEHADAIGPELARRCHDVLADRLRYDGSRDQMQWAHSYVHVNHAGWQELSRRLLDCAAEVSAKLNSK